jgi:menaquinone-dependent protoporphyrinogen oxidase
MSNPILVAFTTKYGSTEEVAQVIASALTNAGFPAVAQPAAIVQSLDRYDAVVLGTALYMGLLHHDAKDFLRLHHDALQHLPVAFFSLGPIYAEDSDWVAAHDQADKELARFPWFHPVTQEIFGGKYDPGKLGFPFRFVAPLLRKPANDARDWDAIEAWVQDQVIPALQHEHACV